MSRYELNQYRIEAFSLRKEFQVFFSSCYLYARKPEEAIYRIALAVTQRAAEAMRVHRRPFH